MNGALYVMMELVILMQGLSVVNLDITQIVNQALFLQYVNNNYFLFSKDPNYYCCRRFGEGVDPIHIEYLSCSGLEYRLNECHNTSSSCRHTEDWSVSCTIGIIMHLHCIFGSWCDSTVFVAT